MLQFYMTQQKYCFFFKNKQKRQDRVQNMVFEGATAGDFRYQNNVRRGWSNNRFSLAPDFAASENSVRLNDECSVFVNFKSGLGAVVHKMSEHLRLTDFNLPVDGDVENDAAKN